MSSANNPPPGWYPQGDGQQWWDGSDWIGDVQVPQSEPARVTDAPDAVAVEALAGEPDRKRRFGKSDDEKEAQRLAKQAADLERSLDKQGKKQEQEQQAFLHSPPGKARTAFARGDAVFQYELDVMTQQAIIVAMLGSGTSKKSTDPTDVLNAVCREGWKLVTGSFVFIHEGEQSRDKFMSSGQNVAVKGRVMGYYLFNRDESH